MDFTYSCGISSEVKWDNGVLTIGNCTEISGEISRGKIFLAENAFDPEFPHTIPVVIVKGSKQTGSDSTVLITANIHGDELTGVISIHRSLEIINPHDISGRIVIFPVLNPTGNWKGTRETMFEPSQDPNRKWPDADPNAKPEYLKVDENDWLDTIVRQSKKPKTVENCWQHVFSIFRAIKPDFHIDLHTAATLSIPFIYIDRVFYSKLNGSAEEATKLFENTVKMCDVLGFTPVLDSAAKGYLKKDMHRSTSGAVLNNLRIPSCTVELGGMHVVDPDICAACVLSMKNLLIHAGMLTAEMHSIDSVVKVVPKAQRVELHRILEYPVARVAGFADFLVKAGDSFKNNDVICIMRSISGERLAEIHAEFDGFVVCWEAGIMFCAGAVLGYCAAPDRLPTIASWEELESTK